MRKRILQLAGEGEQRLGVQYAAGYIVLAFVLTIGLPFIVPDGADDFWLEIGCWGVPLIGLGVYARTKGWGREFIGGFIWGYFALMALLFPVFMAGVFLLAWMAS